MKTNCSISALTDEKDLRLTLRRGPLHVVRPIKIASVRVLIWLAVLLPGVTNAQGYLKATYIAPSKYVDNQRDNSNAEGSVYIIRGGFQLPVAVKMDTVVRGADTIPSQTVWAVRGDVSHTQFNNSHMEDYNFPGQVQNYRAGIIYVHTLSKKWSVYSTLGAGLYTTPEGVHANQVVGEGAVIFIRTILPNLKVGAGLAFDNTFGFPMVYPGLIVDWAIDGKGGKYFARINATEISAGMKYNEKFQLSLNIDAFGASALFKDKMFTHLYYTAGITPEFKIGKNVSIPLTVGATLSRNAYAHERSLTDFFSYFSKDDVGHFKPSALVSAGIVVLMQ